MAVTADEEPVLGEGSCSALVLGRDKSDGLEKVKEKFPNEGAVAGAGAPLADMSVASWWVKTKSQGALGPRTAGRLAITYKLPNEYP